MLRPSIFILSRIFMIYCAFTGVVHWKTGRNSISVLKLDGVGGEHGARIASDDEKRVGEEPVNLAKKKKWEK